MLTIFRETLPFIGEDGLVVANLAIAIESSNAVSPLQRISRGEARQFGEEEVQLLEGFTYQYEIDAPHLELEQRRSISTRFILGGDGIDRGTIAPGLKTGVLHFHLIRDGARCAHAAVEVRSAKLGYRDDYRAMLEDIAETSVDLLLQIAAPSMVSLSYNNAADSASLLQRFFFVRGLLEAPSFTQAIQYLMRLPHSILLGTSAEVSIRRSGRGNRNISRQIASKYPRLPLPSNHPLASLIRPDAPELATIPREIEVTSFEETLDTFENRFIKYAISSFAQFLANAEMELSRRGGTAAEMATRDVFPLRQMLEDLLSSEFFVQISELSSIPLASPVLQRRAGYREIYQAWERFHVAARLTWQGGDDVYGGGKRDVAALYEYWLFFVLWNILKQWSPQNFAVNASRVLRVAEDGFSVTLRQGELLETSGVQVSRHGKSFRVQFSYNRTFAVGGEVALEKRLNYQKTYPSAGSWTRNMRPDFTVSLWPDGMSKSEAEAREEIVHVHLDAKYSVAHIRELFGAKDDDLSDLKQQERSGTFKRGDLLKMHAYRDSIRRSQGAYVLYPGVESGGGGDEHAEYRLWIGYRELLPGLGAFAVRPGPDKDKAVGQISDFLEDVLDHMSEDNSIREQIALRTAELNAEGGPSGI
jgi:predicted component of viral defense system (DUF524 family)